MSVQVVTEKFALLGDSARQVIEARVGARWTVALYASAPNQARQYLGSFDAEELIEFARTAHLLTRTAP